MKTNFTRNALCILMAASSDAALAMDSAREAQDSSLTDEIIVTAQRKAQNVQDIALSISALTSKDLENAHVSNVNDLANITPGLKITLPFGEKGAPSFNIRGIQSLDYGFGQSKPIALYVDEGIRGLGALEIMNMFDIERVEVLKGPQGSLYGKNASGGVVNIITRRPGFQSEAEFTVGYGNYNRKEVRGSAQSAIVDGVLAIRGAFSATKADGWIKNLYRSPSGVLAKDPEALNQVSGRVSLLYAPTRAFEALFRVHSTTIDGTGLNNHAGYNINPDLTRGFTRDGLRYYEEQRDGPTNQEVRNFGLNLTLKYTLQDTIITSITTYDRARWYTDDDFDGLPFVGDHSNYRADNVRQFAHELRVQGDGRNFTWLAGGFYSDDNIDISTALNLLDSAYGIGYRNIVPQSRRSWAIFGRAELELIDGFSLSAGGRYSHDTVRIDNLRSFITDPQALDPREISSPVLSGVSNRTTAKNFSMEASLSYKPTEDILLYTSFRQGYRGPALNGQVFFNAQELTAVKPEETAGYEAGIKTQFQNVRFNAAVFRVDLKNQQYIDGRDVGGSFLTILVNANKARTQGYEAEVKFAPYGGFELAYSLTYLDAEYRNFILAGSQIAGNRMAGSSRWSHNPGFNWVKELHEGTVSLALSATFNSRVYFSAANNVKESQPAMWLVNGRAAWESEDKRWRVGVWAQNLLNKRYIVSSYDVAAALGFDIRTRGRPRTYGLDATVRF